MLKYGIILFILFGTVPGALAQSSKPFLITYNSAGGLSASSINSVGSAPGGAMWIATDNGLNRFDGTHFSSYQIPYGKQVNGLSENKVEKVLCDGLLLWLITGNGGLDCYYDEIDYFMKYFHDPADTNSVASNRVHCFLLAKNKNLYIGTDSGLSIFNHDNSRFNSVAYTGGKGPLDIASLEESGDDIIWMGTYQQGLFYYSKKIGLHAVANTPPGIRPSAINSLVFDKERNKLWLATTNGLWCAGIQNDTILSGWHQPLYALRNSNVRCIRKDTGGNIWMGTLNKGVYWQDINGAEHHFEVITGWDNGLISNCIKDIFCSTDGSVWFSTPAGLQIYHKNLQSFPAYRPLIQHHSQAVPTDAAGLCIWKKYLIAATDQGIWISDTNFSKNTSVFITDKKRQPVSFANACIIDSDMLVTGSAGVYQLIMKGNRLRLVRPPQLEPFRNYSYQSCTELIKANDSMYWLAGANNRIYIMNTRSGQTTFVPFTRETSKSGAPKHLWTKLYHDKGERVLVATNNRMYAYTNTGALVGSANIAGNRSTLPEINVYDLYDDGTYIWLATVVGLYKCNKDLAVLNEYTIENGLCDNTVYCIQPDTKGRLWLATARGLSVYDPASNKFSNYYHQHGLQSHEFKPFGKASFRDRTIYFSSGGGIVQIHPHADGPADPLPSQPIITKVIVGSKIFGKSELHMVNRRGGFTADFGSNIVLSFALVNFLPSIEYALQYTLGDHDVWIDILPGSEIILSGLPPGKHIIHTRGILKDRNITGQSSRVSLSIKPLYYQQWWFIALMIAIATGLAYGLYAFRIQQIKKVISLRTKISQDLHDNVGATLSSISIFSQAAIQKSESGHTAESNSILQRIGEVSRDVIGELNDTVWLINPGNDNLQKIVQRITNYALPLCRAKNIFFEVKTDLFLEGIRIHVDKRKAIYMFLKEAINNSLKYAQADTLTIQFTKSNKSLHVSVNDNGRGIFQETLLSGNGLNNMKQRAKDVNGKVEVNSSYRNGAEIILHLPLTSIGD